jgi:multidrug resistance efflux pump
MISKTKPGTDSTSSHVISLRERAKLARRAAYARAKEARKRNPALLALKQKAKEQRRESYRVAKEAHKARVAAEKAREAAAEEMRRMDRRARMDGVLMELVRRGRQSPSGA